MKLAVVALTAGGKRLAGEISAQLADCWAIESIDGITATLKGNWQRYDGFICIMAAGIVVRAIAPLLENKKTDPCVLVLDEKGEHVISLLSGHLGGGNSLAQKVALITGGRPVITTASDTTGLVALDLWAARQNLTPANDKVLTQASSLLVNRGKLLLHTEATAAEMPAGLHLTATQAEADLVVSHRLPDTPGQLCLHPKNLVIGIGCNRGTPVTEFTDALTELFEDLGFSRFSVRNLASIDAKNDEKGLLEFAELNGWLIHFFSKEQINDVTNVSVSHAALKAVGAIGVAEPTALLSAQSLNLISRKRKWQNITMAVAEADFTLSAQVLDPLNI